MEHFLIFASFILAYTHCAMCMYGTVMLMNLSLSPGLDSVDVLDVSRLNWLLIDLTEYALVFMNETINFHCSPL